MPAKLRERSVILPESVYGPVADSLPNTAFLARYLDSREKKKTLYCWYDAADCLIVVENVLILF